MRQLIILFSMFVSTSIVSQEVIQWRGTDRTGIYNETDLLKSWDKNGPKLLWHFNGLGEGHSSVAIANGKIYVTGLTEGKGHLFVFDMNGKILNKKVYGKEWDSNYNGARGTVTVNDGNLYIYSGTGNLICIDEKTLEIIWKKSIIDDFKGSNINWGLNESPLIIDDKVIITPGGKTNNIVALNKKTGEIIWSSPGKGDLSSYCSPLYIANQQVPLIVTTMATHIVGIEAATGKLLWSHKYENNRNIHPNTPVYDGKDMVLITNGYNKGSVMLRLTNGGRSVQKVWENDDIKSKHGGMVKIGDYVYIGGDGSTGKYWHCVDWNTGEIKYKDNSITAGCVIADGNGMLYCYSEKGEMALVRATPEKFDIVSKFMITLGTEQHWAHPVIHNGILYVRHGNTLMAYKIREK